MVYQLDTPGLEDQAVTTSKIDTGAVTIERAADSVTNALVPVKGIIMFSGAASEVPANWSLCDGSNGTPDLRNKFVISSQSYDSGQNRWETNITGTGTATGGSKDAIVVSHDHTITDPGHSHTITQTDHDHGYSRSSDGNNFGGDGQDVHQNYTSALTGGAQANIDIDDGTTGIEINSKGSSGTNKNLPPYYALAFIMRVT